jgi:hypothetical protein
MSRLNSISDPKALNTGNHDDYTLLYNVLAEQAVNEAQLVDVASELELTGGDTSTKLTYEQALSQIHGGRMGHLGTRGTWLALNKYFPGHRVPYKIVADFVATCNICQKLRLQMNDSIKPVVRHIKPLNRRAVIGVDTLTVTPKDTLGNSYIIVMVNHHTKHAAGYPAKTKDAVTMATALFVYFCTYGMFDSIMSDPGSDLMSQVVAQLNKYLGIRHTVSLVDRHESNGVEGTNKQILRHLKALVYDERIVKNWSSPTVLPLIFFIINSTDSSETGVVPFHAHFGSQDSTYFRMPEDISDSDVTHEFIKLLNENLLILNEISNKFQSELIIERTKDTPADKQNFYQAGDFVLFQQNPDDPLPMKLSPRYLGPFKVVKQVKNDVECQNLVHGSISTYHVERLKIFHGTKEEALQLARLDNDQYVIDKIQAYRGYPLVRTSMEFEVKFADGNTVWLPWSVDLFTTVQYEEYCRSLPELRPLILSDKDAKNELKILNVTAIDIVQPGDTVYVDIRCYHYLWYQSLGLPDPDHTTYVVTYYYTNFSGKYRRKIIAKCAIFDEVHTVDHAFVRSYGAKKVFKGDNMVLVDKEFVVKYPQVLPDESRERLLEKYITK